MSAVRRYHTFQKLPLNENAAVFLKYKPSSKMQEAVLQEFALMFTERVANGKN